MVCCDCLEREGDLISPIFISPPVYQCDECAEAAYEQSIRE